MNPKLEHSHDLGEIQNRLASPPRPDYLRDWIYGGIDGAVTTFAIVSGVVGASLSPTVVLILGMANLFADGFSMAASSYSGTKSERDNYERLYAQEQRHIVHVPEGEREEIRQIFAAKGFTGDDLERAVEVVTANEERWIETMLAEEYGLGRAVKSPLVAGLCTFIAFVIAGSIPLMSYLPTLSFPTTVVATGIAFFAIGAIKSRWSPQRWWASGLETLSIGMAAASVAYGVGYGLRFLVDTSGLG